MHILVVNTESDLIDEFALVYQHESVAKQVEYYPFWELGSEEIAVRFWVICIQIESTRTGSLSIQNPTPLYLEFSQRIFQLNETLTMAHHLLPSSDGRRAGRELEMT
jgi:hypothetical protein